MFEAETQLRVRYAETDKMGFVYYGNYAAYYEVGRTEVMRHFGLTYRKLEDHGILMPVLSLNVNYKKPAHYDDLLTIKTSVRKMPAARITFHYEIYSEDRELLNYGDTSLAFINEKTGRPVRPPKYFLERMAEFFENESA